MVGKQMLIMPCEEIGEGEKFEKQKQNTHTHTQTDSTELPPTLSLPYSFHLSLVIAVFLDQALYLKS